MDLKNFVVEGEYPSFEALPITRHDVFLYTSLRDGMPRTLVSAGQPGYRLWPQTSAALAN